MRHGQMAVGHPPLGCCVLGVVFLFSVFPLRFRWPKIEEFTRIEQFGGFLLRHAGGYQLNSAKVLR